MPESPVRAGLKRRTLGIAAGAVAATAVLGGSAAVATAYAADIAAARARVARGSRIVQTRAGPIEVGIGIGVGIGSGAPQRPLLMIHGTGGGFDQGLMFAQALSAAGWQVIAPSRFGYLRTPLPAREADASSEAQADALAALLDALGIERLPVLGGSAGALPALHLALRHPARCSALVPIVPATFVPERSATPAAVLWATALTNAMLRSDFLFWSGIELAPQAMVTALLATDAAVVASAAAAERARVLRILRGILPVSQRASGILNDARLCSRPAPLALERIGVPTLAVSVEDDRFGTHAAARHIARTVPGAQLLSYPTGGHIWAGHDADLFAQVHAFLTSAARP